MAPRNRRPATPGAGPPTRRAAPPTPTYHHHHRRRDEPTLGDHARTAAAWTAAHGKRIARNPENWWFFLFVASALAYGRYLDAALAPAPLPGFAVDPPERYRRSWLLPRSSTGRPGFCRVLRQDVTRGPTLQNGLRLAEFARRPQVEATAARFHRDVVAPNAAARVLVEGLGATAAPLFREDNGVPQLLFSEPSQNRLWRHEDGSGLVRIGHSVFLGEVCVEDDCGPAPGAACLLEVPDGDEEEPALLACDAGGRRLQRVARDGSRAVVAGGVAPSGAAAAPGGGLVFAAGAGVYLLNGTTLAGALAGAAPEAAVEIAAVPGAAGGVA